jgi:hypothetical protein
LTAARSSGASFSLVLLWLLMGAFSRPASGKEMSESRFSGSLAGCGGVEATTSGSMAGGGRATGRGSLGRGNSEWTICAWCQRGGVLVGLVIRDGDARRHTSCRRWSTVSSTRGHSELSQVSYAVEVGVKMVLTRRWSRHERPPRVSARWTTCCRRWSIRRK